MSNPILQALGQSQLGRVKQMMNMVKAAQNPSAMLNQMLQQNPNYGQISQALQQHNGDYKAAFYDLAKQKGVDPNAILNQLK